MVQSSFHQHLVSPSDLASSPTTSASTSTEMSQVTPTGGRILTATLPGLVVGGGFFFLALVVVSPPPKSDAIAGAVILCPVKAALGWVRPAEAERRGALAT